MENATHSLTHRSTRSDLYDRLAVGHLDALRHYIYFNGNNFDHMAHFVENHDEDR